MNALFTLSSRGIGTRKKKRKNRFECLTNSRKRAFFVMLHANKNVDLCNDDDIQKKIEIFSYQQFDYFLFFFSFFHFLACREKGHANNSLSLE
jgi:hypothetical protein